MQAYHVSDSLRTNKHKFEARISGKVSQVLSQNLVNRIQMRNTMVYVVRGVVEYELSVCFVKDWMDPKG